MHAYRAVSVVVVMALVAAGLVMVASPARAAPVAAAPHPMATDSIAATNQFGNVRSNFYTGYSSGVVYFTAYDPSDASATVTITDTNATRDHIASPAFTYVASFSGGPYNFSWQNGVDYVIPLNLSYGGNWTISISGSAGGVFNTTFFVHTYYASISTVQPGYLPGHPGTGVFFVSADPNNAPYNLASVKIFAQYYTSGGTWSNLPSSPFTFTPVSQGRFNFTVPLTASTSGAIDFVLYANTSVGGSELAFYSVSVGNLSAPVVSVGTCPSGCHTTAFTDGATVYVTVSVIILGPDTPAAGIDLKTSFASGALPASPPGVPSNVTSNATGGASFVFVASSAVFSTKQTDELTVTASDPLNPSLSSISTHVFFTVSTAASVTPQVQVQFDSLQYYGGDTATVTWTLGGLSSSATAGWVVNQWEIIDETGGGILGWGPINSTQSQGQFTMMVPVNYGGTMGAYVTAYNASASIEGFASTHVTAPTILLNPSEPYYLPGDTVTVQVATQGSIFGSTTLYQSVVESSGYQIASGVLSGSQIQFSIPKTGAPSYVTVSVAAQSASLGVVSAATITVDQGSGYVLYAGVSTKSNYADGSFQPGQTIDISYNLMTVGNAILPKTFNIIVYPGYAGFLGSSYGTIAMQATSPSGTVSYTIPSSLPTGAQTFTVVVTSGICGFSCGAVTQFSALVESSPSALGYELGAGSGVTVGWVVLLVLIVLVLLAAFVWARRAGGRSGGRTSGVKPYTSSSPPSGSSSDSAAWKESPPPSSGGGSSPPPMPGSPPSS
ncbi:MAG TPA: hypothetical protein VEY07_02500 [Thermoplasmata archaeon]|nr:hypothetical protein [Thermoplasmata archaeon]